MSSMFAIDSSLRRYGIHLVAGVLVIVLVWLASMTRPWQAAEFKTFDLFTSWAAPRTSDLPIVILAIDEPSFQELQLQWPFPRRLHAALLDRLVADGAAVVAFDVVFSEPSNPVDDQAFADAIRSAGTVVLAKMQERIETGNSVLWTDVVPVRPFIDAGAKVGLVGVVPDDDFVVRRGLSGADAFPSVIRAAGRAPSAAIWAADGGATLIEYAGPRGTFDTRSYYQALIPGLLPPGFFRGKYVLIGRSVRTSDELAGSHTDMFNSPFAVVDGGERLFPGVEIQANLLANQLTGGGIRMLDEAWAWVVVLLAALTVWRLNQKVHPSLALAVAVTLAAGLMAISFVLFTRYRLWLPPLFPDAAIVSLTGAMVFIEFMASRKKALQTRLMFAHYVPPEVVSQLVEHPELLKLGGENREVTLMFTDLANFTAMSEKLSAEDTVEVLTEYFNEMTHVIHRHGGTVDKFIGDAIMAFWGAPLPDEKHAEHAVRAAMEMQAAMGGLVADLEARGLPKIAMRVGLHTGRVVVGNVGSVSRFSYTAIGDAVNLAARLEGVNKAFGTTTLISGETVARLPPGIPLRQLDSVIVKGKTDPVDVFTLSEDVLLNQLSAEALVYFFQRQWDQSEAAFFRLLAHKPDDLAAQRFLGRIAKGRGILPGQPWSPAMSLEKY